MKTNRGRPTVTIEERPPAMRRLLNLMDESTREDYNQSLVHRIELTKLKPNDPNPYKEHYGGETVKEAKALIKNFHTRLIDRLYKKYKLLNQQNESV